MISVIFTTPTEWGRFGKLWNREYVVNKFGIYVYQINDIVQSLTPKLNTLFGYDKAYKKPLNTIKNLITKVKLMNIPAYSKEKISSPFMLKAFKPLL